MPQYMVVYKTSEMRPTGIYHDEVHSQFFEEQSDSITYFDAMWSGYPNLVEIERYDYAGPGVGYVRLDRKHRDL